MIDQLPLDLGLSDVTRPVYVYAWGNNTKRATMKGRTCRVIHRTKTMNTALIEFTDNGQREVISRNALRRAKSQKGTP